MSAERKRLGLPTIRLRHTSITSVWLLVAIPTLVIASCGVLILLFQKDVFDQTIGIVLVCLCVAIGAGTALTIAGLMRDRRLAELQLDFVSKVSHELKTPLTSIRMFTDTLRLGRVTDPEGVERCISVISKETDRLTELISRLLSWGAMEQGAFTIETERTSVEAVVRETMERVEHRVSAMGIELQLDLEDELPLFDVDRPAMVDALVNLISNATKYGGGHPVVLRARRRGEDRIELSVEDRGVGIELSHQGRIFERFYRADERYIRSRGGTGLGLAIARHIVLAHGGNIELRSRPNHGSTFTIVLPAVKEEQR